MALGAAALLALAALTLLARWYFAMVFPPPQPTVLDDDGRIVDFVSSQEVAWPPIASQLDY
jgi:hypothetical protein